MNSKLLGSTRTVLRFTRSCNSPRARSSSCWKLDASPSRRTMALSTTGRISCTAAVRVCRRQQRPGQRPASRSDCGVNVKHLCFDRALRKWRKVKKKKKKRRRTFGGWQLSCAACWTREGWHRHLTDGLYSVQNIWLHYYNSNALNATAQDPHFVLFLWWSCDPSLLLHYITITNFIPHK